MVQNEEARTAENSGKNIASHSPGETRAKMYMPQSRRDQSTCHSPGETRANMYMPQSRGAQSKDIQNRNCPEHRVLTVQ